MAYDELRKIDAKEFAELRYCHCLGCSAAQWRTIWERLQVWQEVFFARRKYWSVFRPHVWLTGPYKLSVSERSIFDSANVQLRLW